MFCAVCGSYIEASPTHCPRCGASLPQRAARAMTVTDDALARSLGQGILLGRAFAFVSATAFLRPGLGWITRLLGGASASRPLVVSLFDRRPVLLPGVTMSPPALPPLSLAAVTSDKALYREGRDEDHREPRRQEAPAHFAVCVRNMFKEERGGNPGAMTVTVLPA